VVQYISGRRVVFNLKVDIGKQSLFYAKKKIKKKYNLEMFMKLIG